ncbi:MAG: bifunctional precorrin-2 dehydrogenase/sirohydrochlorin ferrochelatase, partial [Bacillota bacterium]|nr:bifunctional precorrin-2 dehydrogenase/sirohydrochlorin ferrochelatase [Bacillota bacterium]
MSYLYPIYLNLADKSCIVIGGGNIAERKIKSLLECKALVTVISPESTDTIDEMADEGLITLHRRKYAPFDLTGAFLVISATNNEEVNKQVANECFENGILVNVVDVPPLCNFFVPSIIRRGDFSISISTGGKSPLLASKLRKELEGQYGDEYEKFLNIMGHVRQLVLNNCDDPAKRKKIFQQLVESDILELLKEGKEVLAKERVEECLLSLWD